MFIRAGLGAALLAGAVLAGGCTAEKQAPTAATQPQDSVAQSPEPVEQEPVASPPPVDPKVVKAGVRTLQRYLDAWATRGLVAAGRYLVPGERIGKPNGQNLLAGGVGNYEVAAWHGPEHFTLEVWMSLTAEDLKDPFQARLLSSFNQHLHQVTVRRTPTGRYLLSFAGSA